MPTQRPDASVNGWNAEYVLTLYEQWSSDAGSVDERWQAFFEGFDLGSRVIDDEGAISSARLPAKPETRALICEVAHTSQGRVDSLIYHYRDLGHLAANIDPLGSDRPFPEQLTLDSFGLGDEQLNETFDPGHLPLENPSTLADIIQCLEDTYCRDVGVEYMHIQDRDQRRWLQKRMETVRNKPAFEREHRLRILNDLLEATALEHFLDTRYKGKKWFSLAGAESLIPLFNEFVELGPIEGVEEFTCGMAHRGRVNVLVNIFNKTYEELFTEFHEAWEEDYLEGGGDVKYHRGYSCDHITTSGQKIRLTMASNPSHLEFVYPVVLGRCRAKQRLRKNEAQRDQVVPIVVHGDASFPGQGVVAECLNMMRLDGYKVGGAIHIIVNNQIGFTTNADDARSGRYCTDLAKMVEAPIFHVNGDDPETCAFVARLAIEFRQAFKKDVVIDMWCYRKYGHNESDEPAFTQPLMYNVIKQKKQVLDMYMERLSVDGVIARDESEKLREDIRTRLDLAQSRSTEQPVDPTPDPFSAVWTGLTDEYSDGEEQTTATLDELKLVAKALGNVPKDFTPHRKLKKLLDARGRAIAKDEPLDWAMGELLAFGTLLLDGHAVRLTGQDVERGTFSHRHSVLFDQNNGAGYTSLNHIAEKQSRFCIHNSPLSESSCVGYEWGYSLTDPQMLVVWEAQFGDFANGAQVIIDQFIASGETKWSRNSGLVLLLPHGYEGQGPEHSSARLERFLQLCADENLQVIYPTTPAQMFHALRRQIKRNFRKPLIVMTPKSLLRSKDAVSTAADLTSGAFRHVIDDQEVKKPSSISRLILCSGKIYYELNAKRVEEKHDSVAIIRVEMLYPFPQAELQSCIDRYKKADEILWVQEEPLNAGAYRFVESVMREEMEIELNYVGREVSATPAVGSSKMHAEEQAEILAQAFAPFDLEEEPSRSTSRNGSADKSERRQAVAVRS